MSGPGYPTEPPAPGMGYAAPVPGMGMNGLGMTLGQILERILWLLRRHLRLYVGLACVPGLALVAVFALFFALAMIMLIPYAHSHSEPPAARVVAGVFLPVLLAYLAILPVFGLYAAAASYAVVRTNFGHAVTWREAWAIAWERRGRYIGLFFLLILIVAGPLYILIAVDIGTSLLFGWGTHGHAAAPIAILIFAPLFALVMLCGLAYQVVAALHVLLALHACVIEGLPAIEAIRRSAALTKGAKGRIFVALLVVCAAAYVLNLLSMIVFLILLSVLSLIGTLIHMVLSSAASLFFIALLAIPLMVLFFLALIALPYSGYATALGVLYCDQRMREGSISPAMPPAGGLV
jgi:MFS family permease